MPDRRKFIRQTVFTAIGASVLPAFSASAGPRPFTGSAGLPRSTPEQQGIPSAGIMDFLDAITEIGQEFHSLMILRHGYVVAEGWWQPYSREHRQQLYSLSKSFTGTAVGLAAEEGLLHIDDPVIKFFPDLLPPTVSDHLAALQIRHLLSMTVGHGKDSILILEASAPGVPWEKTFLEQPVVVAPGSVFMYNSGASFMLSAIIKRVTGKTAHEYLRPRIYEPLGITNTTWGENFEGINMGASHLRMPTEDIAKFGQLYLQKGNWNGRQVISESWVKAASSKQIDNGHNDSSWGYGYGYQFWLNPPGGFRADGAFGQYSMILPELDAVVAITSESISTKDTMQIVWDRLLPVMKSGPLPAAKGEHRQLVERMKNLAYVPPRFSAKSPLIHTISGRTFLLDDNPFHTRSIGFDFSGEGCTVTLKEDGRPDIKIRHGIHSWVRDGNYKPAAHSMFSLRRIDFDSIVAASATWKDPHTLVLSWRFIETVHGDQVTCVFDGDKVTLSFLFSVNRLQNKADDRADIQGKLEV